MDATVVYENSEIHLYKNLILEEMGDYQAALEHLNKVENKILDKTALKESRGELIHIFIIAFNTYGYCFV